MTLIGKREAPWLPHYVNSLSRYDCVSIKDNCCCLLSALKITINVTIFASWLLKIEESKANNILYHVTYSWNYKSFSWFDFSASLMVAWCFTPARHYPHKIGQQ